MQVVDNPAARSAVFEHIEWLEAQPGFGEPTEQIWADHDEMMDQLMAQSHKTDRGARELALALDMSQKRFMAMFAGKSVLDVGCGEGVLDAQLARTSTTRVTALDNDPAMLARVPDMPNIRKVEGSGYDIQSALGNEQFDVVLSASSTLMWARSTRQAEQEIDSAIAACKPGGTALFILVLQHIRSHELYRTELRAGRVPGYAPRDVHPEGLRFVRSSVDAASWLRAVKIRRLEAAENSGRIACAYVASPQNKSNKRINRMLGPEHIYEDYSVVATVLDA